MTETTERLIKAAHELICTLKTYPGWQVIHAEHGAAQVTVRDHDACRRAIVRLETEILKARQNPEVLT